MIVISAEETQQVLTWEPLIDSIVEAYRVEADPRSSPGRLIAANGAQSMRCMPAISPMGRYMGTKHVVKSPDGFRYAITLFDKETSELAFVIDGIHITAMRTAATSAAALIRLSHHTPIQLAVLGSGTEARNHLAAIASVRDLSHIRVFSPSDQSRLRFVEWARAELGLDVEAAGSAERAVDGARCVVAAARAQGEKPVLHADWIAAADCVVSVGSTLPVQRELDVSVLAAAALVVADEPSEVLNETGDLLAAAVAGVDVAPKLRSFHSLVRHQLDSELSATPGLRVFKSVGSGLQDVAAAERIAQDCLAAGLGLNVEVSLTLK